MAASSTHFVTNQTPSMAGYNAFRLNPLLLQIASSLETEFLNEFDQIGRFTLSPEAQDLARMANENTPQLKSYDKHGNRADEVEFHPAYHALMRRSMAYGLASSVWEDAARGNKGGHLKRAIRYFLMAGLETGHLAALSSTNGAVASLILSPQLAKEWVPRVTTRKYDSAHKSPIDKNCLLLSYGIAEKQAGTDFSALSTRAEPVKNGVYRIVGHKWFLPSPMADAFIVLARLQTGISCFLVPRFLADNEHNQVHFMALKDKLGGRSAATAEVEFDGSIAQMVGEEGAGEETIGELLALTRMDAAVSLSSIMHVSLAEAVHHARHRKTFGKHLVKHSLMTRVLADMAIDVAGSMALCFRLARAYDNAKSDPLEADYARLMTPVAKYWCGKLSVPLIAEAMEVVGGNAAVETSVMPRHFREAANININDGTGNLAALQVVGMLKHSRDISNGLLAEVESALGTEGGQTRDVLTAAFDLARHDEGAARIATEQLALAAAAAELTRLGTGTLAQTFVETRLTGVARSSYGMLDARFDASTILDALYPPIS